jgi:hypothetical protein
MEHRPAYVGYLESSYQSEGSLSFGERPHTAAAIYSALVRTAVTLTMKATKVTSAETVSRATAIDDGLFPRINVSLLSSAGLAAGIIRDISPLNWPKETSFMGFL